MLAHPLLLKAARIILEWDQPTLAERAGVALSVITNLEKQRGIRASSWLKVQKALENGGIVFLPEQENNGLGAGLRARDHLVEAFTEDKKPAAD